MSRDGRKGQAFTVGVVHFHRRGVCLPQFVNDHRFAGPGIHYLTGDAAPGLNFDVVNARGILAGGNQKAAARLEVAKSHFRRRRNGREQINASAAAVEHRLRIAASAPPPPPPPPARPPPWSLARPSSVKVSPPRLPGRHARTVRAIMSFCSWENRD